MGGIFMERIWHSKAVAFMKLERYKVALHCCDRGLEANPKDWEILLLKGIILEKLGQYADAMGCYRRVVDVNPHSGQAWYNLGAAHGNFGEFRKALGCFQEAERQGYPNATAAIKMCQETLSREEFMPRMKTVQGKSKLKSR
jgi:tetratricopeptide (TPR) repeat protein